MKRMFLTAALLVPSLAFGERCPDSDVADGRAARVADFLADSYATFQNQNNGVAISGANDCLSNRPSQELQDAAALGDVLRKCVFIQEGAYDGTVGPAITDGEQDMLVYLAQGTLLHSRLGDGLRLSLVDETTIYGDIIYANCLLKVESPEGDVAYLEGYSVD